MYLEDKRVRLAAFSWLVSPAQSIFRPRVLAEIPISSMTSPKSNNNDLVGPSACFFAAFEAR